MNDNLFAAVLLTIREEFTSDEKANCTFVGFSGMVITRVWQWRRMKTLCRWWSIESGQDQLLSVLS